MEEAKEKLQLPKEVPILLFFGTLSWDKGLDLLLESVKYIEKDFRLVIAGPPRYFMRSNVAAYKKQLNDPTKIIERVKYIPEEELSYYFLSADAVVLPYRKVYKGTSGILQRASAAGKPVIVTDVGEIGKIVNKHSLGIVVEPESIHALIQGILRFLADRKAITNTVVQNAVHYAEQHHWRKMAAIVELAYRFQ